MEHRKMCVTLGDLELIHQFTLLIIFLCHWIRVCILQPLSSCVKLSTINTLAFCYVHLSMLYILIIS